MADTNIADPGPINDVTATVTTPVAKSSSVVDPGPIKVGSVRLRGVSVSLDADDGQAFITDCCRHTEGLLSETEIKTKWTLADGEWANLADNTPLLQSVRAERERRIFGGHSAREDIGNVELELFGRGKR
jgi:hypothetical protein